MQKSIIIERNSVRDEAALNKLLFDGWVVEKMLAFKPALANSAGGSTYNSYNEKDEGAILVILENLGVDDPV